MRHGVAVWAVVLGCFMGWGHRKLVQQGSAVAWQALPFRTAVRGSQA